jgi:predicted protein tyrosine phosphatase
MVEIYPNLFIGSDEDSNNWNSVIIHAARDPWFKKLNLSPRILWHEEENELTLNLVDARSAAYIPLAIIDFTIDFINKKIKENKVLLHCNAGLSRSASIGFIFLLGHTDVFKIEEKLDLDKAAKKYLKIYKNWSPGPGMAAICYHYFKNLTT